jgi:carboxyl-terminal processing protease
MSSSRIRSTAFTLGAAILLLLVWQVVSGKPSNDDLYTYTKLYSNIAFRIEARYVEEVNTKSLIYAGIKGMMETLDPFSEFLESKAYDRIMESTSGRYSGLGMTIFMKDKIVTVVSPMEGTPAYRMGLKAGDKIVKIDAKSTEGMTTEEASGLMRGPEGTEVTLTIEREGVEEPLNYTITRAVIEIKTVPYYGVVDGKYGYIRLASFGQQADTELREAIENLKSRKVEGLVLDLRRNGGGLLTEAVSTSNLFLDKGKLIVYTRGRVQGQSREYKSLVEPLLPKTPLVVLVDDNSASASEILSGAVQDWDRGIIIGNPTFGKGLVQQIYDMGDGTALKLTTAKWYIPSGRCIQKETNSRERLEESEEAEPDSTEQEIKREEFRTKGGRIVYGGGGVVPDIEVPEHEYTPLQLNLERLSTFFDFATRYTAHHPDLPEDFEVSQEMVGEFREFLKEIDFSYKNSLEIELENLEKAAEKKGSTERLKQQIDNLRRAIEAEKEREFEEDLPYVKKSMKRDMLTRLYGQKAVYEQVVLKTDACIQKALELLKDKEEYKKILKG